MDCLKLGRLYKGEEYTMTLPVPFSSDVDDFQFLLFTDSATTVEIPKSQITIEDGVMEFTVHETDLDVLNDGVLNYYLKYTVGSTDKIQCTNTMHYLKSPADYNPETTTDIYNNGYQSGYTQGLEDAGGEYADGYVAGIEEQKSKLSGITITENGEYTRADGYSGITVNVPQTGTVATYQTKNFSIDNNGDTTITVDDGYDGITGGTIHVSVPQTGHTDAELEAAYTSGYTGGEIAGIAEQKALLTSITATTNNTYSTENGYGTVVVNVPQNLRPEYKLAGVCMYYVRSTVYAEMTVTFSIPQGVIAMYLNDDTPIDISSGRYTYSNTGSTDYTLVLTIYTSTMIDTDIIRYLHNKTMTSMTFYGNVMWGQCPNETIKPSWASTILDITTGMCKSNHLIMTQRCGFSNVERINFDVPLAWVYDYTSMSFPQCSSIYLTANTTYAPEYRGSYSTVKFNLQNTGTLYCKQSIYDNLAASGFWSHFPTGWTISPTL